jgi:pilus assembly protein Flp/PilA
MRRATVRRVREQGERGASAVEYGLIVGAIAAVIVIAAFGLGRVVQATFSDSCDTITSTIQTSSGC